MKDADIIVIGSGAGGLAAALALARAGRRVIVLEQHYLPGGWCQSFSLSGFQFSPGVHYIGQLQPGGRMRAIYEGLGLGEDLRFLEINPEGFDHVVIGGERFDIPRGKDRFAERLKRRFSREASGIDACLDAVARLGAEIEGGIHARGPFDLLAFPFRYPAFSRWGWLTLDRFLDRFVSDPMLRGILTIQCGDHGLPPSKAPAALHAAVMAHYFDGAYYPKGGGKAIPRAFIRGLRKHGGEILLRARVDRILIERGPSGPRVTGVRLGDGTEIAAPTVVSNADPHATHARLVGLDNVGRAVRRRLARTRYSVSCISLFLGVDMDARAAGLDSGNVWYGRTTRTEDAYDFAMLRDPLSVPEIPGAFLTVPTLKDPSKRQDGLHTMESFCFISPQAFRRWHGSEQGARSEEYERFKAILMERMVQALENVVPGLRRHVVFQALGTPLTNSHYVAATEGNLYGTEKTLGNLGPMGYPVSAEIGGLFMCGASTLGHGVAGATASGLAAARAILRCRTSDLLTAGGPSIEVYPCEDPGSWPETARPIPRGRQLVPA